MSITDATTASILVKSARHCCICRRFSPLQIQIHHIIEKSDGGSDEEENLIPICIVCHSSVHTKSQMTKNFSSAELKGHRDQVYDMVAKGKLPVQPQITGSEIHEISAAIIKTLNNDGNAKKLSDQAIEILLASACEQSEIKILRSEHAFTIKTGLQEFHLRTSDSKQYPEEILELAQKGYINLNEDAATLTESGIAHTQELVKVTARFIEKRSNA